MGYQIVPFRKLQRIQNMCARLVLRRGKRDSISQSLNQLHWLLIKSRIIFKVLVLTYKLLHGEGLGYLKKLLTVHKPQRQGLRSSKRSDLLVIPITKRKTFVARSFSVATPALWNNLLSEIRESNTLLSFKNKLKTHLFTYL